ncbi:hypothetical protein Tco_1107803 [Tanacetum coccineum]
MFNVGNTKVASIRDPRVKLAYRCIATTIAARKKTTHRITKIDLYYLYCIYTPEVACKIPYWLAKYFKGMREKNLIYGGMLVTRIARSFKLLTSEWRSALSVDPQPHVFKKKSLIVGTGYSLKDKNEAKPDKTESGIGKSAKYRSRRHKYLIGPTCTRVNGPAIDHLSSSDHPVITLGIASLDVSHVGVGFVKGIVLFGGEGICLLLQGHTKRVVEEVQCLAGKVLTEKRDRVNL